MDMTGILGAGLDIKPVKVDESGKDYAFSQLKKEMARIERKRLGNCYCSKCGDTKLIPAVRYYPDLNKYYFGFEICACVNAEAVKAAISESGLENELKIKTFATFKADEEYQKSIKAKAIDYLKSAKQNKRMWFYIGGQSGAGKSHICTAIANRFLQNNYKLRYMCWIDELRQMKNNFGSNKLQVFKECDVLYVDDLFKGSRQPSEYEIGVAFEIINYRDSNNLITLISSEMTDSKLKGIDEAIHGRIKAHTGDEFMINIQPDENKNYRLKGKNISLFGGNENG